jgi:hypothetical protein
VRLDHSVGLRATDAFASGDPSAVAKTPVVPPIDPVLLLDALLLVPPELPVSESNAPPQFAAASVMKPKVVRVEKLLLMVSRKLVSDF